MKYLTACLTEAKYFKIKVLKSLELEAEAWLELKRASMMKFFLTC